MKSDATTFDPSTFLSNPKICGVLFYGSEKGLKDYFTTIFSRLGSLTLLSENTFLEAPSHYFMPDLFATENAPPLLCIEDVSDKKSQAYEAILADAPQAKLILYGGSLKTTSKLVQFAVKQLFMQAVGCYPLGPRQMMPLLQKTGQYFHLTFTPEAIKGLVHQVTPATLFQDVMKLSLYKGKEAGEIISLEDVIACLGEAQEESGELAFALSGRRPDLVAPLVSKIQDTLEPIALLRQVLRHFMLLLQVRCALDNKASLAEAMSQLSPPLFFKKVPLFQTHIQSWSLPQIYKALGLLEKAEMALKSSLSTRETITYFLSQIAREQKIR